MVPSIQ